MKKQKLPRTKRVYLIIRGEKPEYHEAPFTPIILCSRNHIAKWEAGETSDGATVFENMSPTDGGNWLLCRYKGYDIDYGNISKYITLFDGVESKGISEREKVNELIKQSVWWSYDEIPQWVKDLGVQLPSDDFTKERIIDDYGTCRLTMSQQDKLEETIDKYELAEWLYCKKYPKS